MSLTTLDDNGINLRWAVRSDIPEITRILFDNTLTFQLKDHWAPTRAQHPEAFYQWLLSRVRIFFATPKYRLMVAEQLEVDVDEQQTRVLGFAGWIAEGEGNPLATAWSQHTGSSLFARSTSALGQWLVQLESSYHRHVRNRIVDFAALARTLGKLHDAGPEYKQELHLRWLFVDKRQQRTGVGRRLLMFGTRLADRYGLPITLASSRIGYPFYLKHGFTLSAFAHIDTNPEFAFDMPLLVYQPESKDGHD